MIIILLIGALANDIQIDSFSLSVTQNNTKSTVLSAKHNFTGQIKTNLKNQLKFEIYEAHPIKNLDKSVVNQMMTQWQKAGSIEIRGKFDFFTFTLDQQKKNSIFEHSQLDNNGWLISLFANDDYVIDIQFIIRDEHWNEEFNNKFRYRLN